jgi:hypothetical protein
MSITTYAELQQAILDHSHRSDLSVKVADFIMLAEQHILRDFKLRVNEASTTVSPIGNTMPIPAGAQRIERLEVTIGTTRRTLDYTSPNGIEQLTISSAEPTRYTVEAGTIRIIPAPAASYSYTLYYIPDLTPLSNAAPVNWALTNAPDAYLFGSLCHLARYTQDDAAFERYTPMFMGALDAVKRIDEGRRLPISGGLQIKPRGFR